MANEIAVAGCTVDISIPEEKGSLTCTHTESGSTEETTINNTPTYFGSLTSTLVMVPATALVLVDFPTPTFEVVCSTKLTITIEGSNDNATLNGDKAVMVNDSGKAKLSYIATNTQTGVPTPGTVEVTAKISDAGQSDVTLS